jgi:hypothetical protein
VSKAATRPSRHALDILRHYVDNPQTADSLEGIAGWRLLEEIVQRRVIETDAALQWLVEYGYLERCALRGSPPVYRLNPDRRTEAEHLLGRRERSRSATSTRRKRS